MMNAFPLVGSRPRNHASPFGLRYSSLLSDIGCSLILRSATTDGPERPANSLVLIIAKLWRSNSRQSVLRLMTTSIWFQRVSACVLGSAVFRSDNGAGPEAAAHAARCSSIHY